jgi:hypothetical protein
VDTAGNIRGVDKINADRFVATAAPEPLDASSRPRVRLSKASVWFETMAESSLRVGQLDRSLSLLMVAIRHDLIRIQREEGRLRPSFRLYDRLAGVAVRWDRRQYLVELVSLLRAQAPAVATQFERRLLKWADPASRWSRRWEDKTAR